MQDPKATHARKAWYQRARDMAATTWRSIPNKIPPTSPSSSTRPTNKIWKTMTKGISIFPTTTTTTTTTGQQQQQQRRLRKCSSLGVARVCLCAPISYADIFRPADNYYIPPRRSNSYPRSKSMLSGAPVLLTSSSSSPRPSVESRRAIFRGKSLTEDVLMRRFVVEEEAGRKRDQMEVIRRRSHLLRKRKKLGPSPLSRMLTASSTPPHY